jgi:hypothetical protein
VTFAGLLEEESCCMLQNNILPDQMEEKSI